MSALRSEQILDASLLSSAGWSLSAISPPSFQGYLSTNGKNSLRCGGVTSTIMIIISPHGPHDTRS